MATAEGGRRPAIAADQRPRSDPRQRTVVEVKLPDGARPRIGDRWQHAGATWLVLLADDIDDRWMRLTLIRGVRR